MDIHSHGVGAIRDLHPAPGKPDAYHLATDSKTRQLETDYALISLLPGTAPGQDIVVLAGLTTLGTEAAAEVATSPSQMAVLLKMREATEVQSSYFQCLLQVQVQDGAIARITPLVFHEVSHK